MPREMTQIEVVNALKKAVGASQNAWAKSNGLVTSYVNDVINGRRGPSPSILKALGLEKVVTYRKRPAEEKDKP